MKALTQEERQALIDYAKLLLNAPRGRSKEGTALMEIALAALTSEPVAAREGWKLVPVEPTMEMVNAAQASTAWDRVDFWDGFYDDKAAYQAMLAAAPEFK